VISESEAAVVTQSEEKQAHEEPVALAVSVSDFSALEERIRRAVLLVKREREAELETHASQAGTRQLEIEARAAQAEAQVHEQSALVEQLKGELNALRAERDQVRERVERLLKQLDALEL
jgi:chromosome segregation ATPase